MKKTKFKQTEIGKIPEDWEFRPVSFFCSKITSGGTPSRAKKEFWEKASINWLKTKELLDGNIYSTEEKISESGLKNSSAKLFPKETVIMAMYGATVGKLGITKIETSTNQACCAMIVDKNKSIPRFLFYELLYNRKKLINLSSGAAQQNLNQDIIKEFYLPFPPHPEQSAIAKILSDLDSKIELNQQMNKTLEAIGQAIFKRWFIDFEFPNENGEPYKSSGGEMVESEVGEIPKGWRVGKLGDIIDKRNNSVKAGESLKERKYVPIDKLPMKQLSFNDYLPYNEAKSSLISFEKDDILLGAMRVYFHRVNISPFEGVTRTTTFVLRPKKTNLLEFSLFLLYQDSTIDFANQNSRGSTMPYAVWKNSLENMQIIIPDDKTLSNFSKLLSSIIERIRDSIFELRNLEQIRDSLLPKLMSGKIRVPVEVRA